MKNGIEITEFNAKFWAIFEILDFKGSQLSERHKPTLGEKQETRNKHELNPYLSAGLDKYPK